MNQLPYVALFLTFGVFISGIFRANYFPPDQRTNLIHVSNPDTDDNHVLNS